MDCLQVKWCMPSSQLSLLSSPLQLELPLFSLFFFLHKFTFNSLLPFPFRILFFQHGIEASGEVLVHALNFFLEASSYSLSFFKRRLCDLELFLDCTSIVSYSCLSNFMILKYTQCYTFMFILVYIVFEGLNGFFPH